MTAAAEHLTRALSPVELGGAWLRNRVVKAATFEGMTPGGRPSQRLIEHHARLARGGVGLTTVAYAAVCPEGRTFAEQLLLSDDNMGALRELTDAVHAEGGAVSVQLAHCGGFTKLKSEARGARGPSRGLNLYGLLSGVPVVRPMSEADIERTTEHFVFAVERACRAGFDAVEVHLGHGYLLSQFLSPSTNRRHDEWGGSAEARARFPVGVVEAVRRAVGDELAVLCKLNLDDGFRGGLTSDASIDVARRLEDAGVDAIVMSGGSVSRNAFYLLRGGRPLRAMIGVEKRLSQKLAMALFGPFLVRRYPFEELFFLDKALAMRAAVSVPLVLLGGITAPEHIATAMERGFDFVAMGRALISDPDLIREIAAGRVEGARCDHCNLCVAEMDRGGVRCVLDD